MGNIFHRTAKMENTLHTSSPLKLFCVTLMATAKFLESLVNVAVFDLSGHWMSSLLCWDTAIGPFSQMLTL